MFVLPLMMNLEKSFVFGILVLYALPSGIT